ncbi:MAG: hypothetical protein LUQ23_02865 [Methanomicrobiales archaeon]|nr:hypothetical protein [Methanomicrobiales archaeon]
MPGGCHERKGRDQANRIYGIYLSCRESPLVLERQERTAFILLVTVLAILLAGHLILTGLGKAPFASPYSDMSREGDLVFVMGPVGAITPTSTGGHLLLTVNGTRVFIPSPASREISLRVNDTVRIYGIVQIYQGTREVAVSDARDIEKEEGALFP